ncbi:hypothetical protein [Variovorax sp.]|uniref:hypothetical protein n=1 Tax=Variovorax sp. TaxID=1871043 RepID=UPI003BA8FFF2
MKYTKLFSAAALCAFSMSSALAQNPAPPTPGPAGSNAAAANAQGGLTSEQWIAAGAGVAMFAAAISGSNGNSGGGFGMLPGTGTTGTTGTR